MADESKKDDLSKASQGEHLYRVVKFITKSTLGALAPVGLSAIAAELFDLLVSDPAVKRRDRFLSDLAGRLDVLEAEGTITLDDLEGNEEVAALLFRATQAAMRSSGDQKFAALREAALRGLLGPDSSNATPAQVVVGLLDRMTEYHVILLRWESRAPRGYTLGQVQAENGDEARRSYFYGQPVFTKKSDLLSPVSVFSYMDWHLYVEESDYTSFKLARADLAAMGLLEPVLGREDYLVGRRVNVRTTPDVVGYKLSDLGRFVLRYISE